MERHLSTVIYARYSSDRQRETSIDDQIRVCRARAEALGMTVIAEYRDEAVSGSTPIAYRPGASALMGAKFSVLLLESLDRLSRDMIEAETVVRRLEHRGVRIIGVSDGYDSESSSRKLQRGMRGIISEVYLDDLRYRTHRGLSGQVARGLFAGGLPFGYRSVPAPGGHVLQIDDEQATVVRRVFEAHAAGTSAPAIARQLNESGIPSPRGSTWVTSAIYGSPDKGTGILNNDLYRGKYIWNRSKWVKDPDTGKRQRLERPESEWQIETREDLRIIPDELWDRVRARFVTPTRLGGSMKGKRPTTLFGGLLRCGICGGAVVAVNPRLYGCAARKDRGPTVCAGVYGKRTIIDTRLMGEARAMVLEPATLADLTDRTARAIKKRLVGTDYGKQRADLENQIARVVDAITAVGGSDALIVKLRELEARRDAIPETTIVLPDRAAILTACRKTAMQLSEALTRDVPLARQALADLFGPITISMADERTILEFEQPAEALLKASGLSLGLVAGARFRTKRRIEL
jgi:DNA invertase Pin-like site-specific DNA recombinase